MKNYKDSVYCRFLNFLLPEDKELSLGEIQEDLRKKGINLEPARSKIETALINAKAQQDAQMKLSRAAEKRISLLEQLANIPKDIVSFRDEIQKVFQTLSGAQQKVLYHRLQETTSEEDLKSIVEDIKRLDFLGDDENGNKP